MSENLTVYRMTQVSKRLLGMWLSFWRLRKAAATSQRTRMSFDGGVSWYLCDRTVLHNCDRRSGKMCDWPFVLGGRGVMLGGYRMPRQTVNFNINFAGVYRDPDDPHWRDPVWIDLYARRVKHHGLMDPIADPQQGRQQGHMSYRLQWLPAQPRNARYDHALGASKLPVFEVKSVLRGCRYDEEMGGMVLMTEVPTEWLLWEPSGSFEPPEMDWEHVDEDITDDIDATKLLDAAEEILMAAGL